MGLSQPTVRDQIDKKRDEMKQYRRALYQRRQESFDEIWVLAREDAHAIKAAGLPDVDWGMLFAICRGQQHELNELQERIDVLEGAD